jgi:hypothetical protein
MTGPRFLGCRAGPSAHAGGPGGARPAAGLTDDGAGRFRGTDQAHAAAVGRVGTSEPSTLPAVDVQAFS